MESRSTVAVIGIWHLGIITAACLADYGHKVVGIDPKKETVENLNKGKMPLFEPGLDELAKEGMKKGALSFTTDFKTGLKGAQSVIIAFDTPVNDDDTPDLSPIMDSISKSIPYLEDGVLIILSSQIPVGTCEKIKAMIQKERKALKFGVACIPENLKLGEAISRFKSPDIIVIGSDSEANFKKARSVFGFVDSSKIKEVNFRTAEMVKHAINSFLANQISWSNEMGDLCDTLGVDWYDVIPALSLDQRVGKGALLKSGLAFGGGTLARDVGVLRRLGKENGASTKLLDAVIEVNKSQNRIVLEKLRALFGNLKGLKVGVLGLTYKPGTSTIRRSASIDIIKELGRNGVLVKAYDPKAEFSEKEAGIKIERCDSPADAAKASDALLILTAWPEFKELKFSQFKASMAHAVIIDPLNMLRPEEISKQGFTYSGIGRGQRIKKL